MRTTTSISKNLALLALILFPAVATATPDGTLGGGRIEVYFTTPGVDAASAQDPAVDDAVIALIESAQTSLDVCLYDFNHAGLVDALLAAHDRGVNVRFVGDFDEDDQYGYVAFAGAGVPSSLRVKSGIMHDKFLVVDGRWTVTGSMNFSDAGVFRNNNNALIVDDVALAATYATEFQQMFMGKFGTDKVGSIAETYDFGPTMAEVAFAPKDDPENVVLAALASADHAIYFMTFSFTRNDFADAMIARHTAGVEVVGIYDTFTATGNYSTDEALVAGGATVLLDGNNNTIGASGGKLHHKVMIIDPGTDSDPIVITGSYNWSGNASDVNDENVVVLHGAEAVAPFMAELCEVYDLANPHPNMTGPLADPCAVAIIPTAPALRINELLPNPDGTDAPEELVELVNAGDAPMDLTGVTLSDAIAVRHTFAGGVLEPGAAIVVYGGVGNDPSRVVASSGQLSLNNTTETVTLRAADGSVLDSVSYATCLSGVALNRVADGGLAGDFANHTAVSTTALAMSPGLRADGSAWIAVDETPVDETPVDETPAPVPTVVTEQASGAPALHEWTFFGPFEVVDGTFDVVMSGTGDPDLYVLEGAAPTLSTYACRPWLTGGAERCTVSGAGSYYIGVYGYTASTFSLDITYTKLVTPEVPVGSAELVVASLLADPNGTDLGQEFVVIANVGTAAADLSGYTVADATSVRHLFAEGTTLAAGASLVLFDRGDHLGAVLTSTTQLSLNNGGDSVILADAAANVVDSVTYTGSAAGQVLTRGTDF